ncbi:hypothetical protein [Actinophytocola sediminis]
MTDRDLCARLRSGDRAAGAELLARHHPISAFALAALAAEQATTILTTVWHEVLGEVTAGTLPAGVRAEVLGRLIAALADQNLMDTAPPPPPRDRFLPATDRWAGWWRDDPAALESDQLTRPSMLAALRQVPIEARAVLVLRDAAGLDARAVEAILRANATQQDAVLDDARRRWVDVLTERAGR